MSHFIVSISVVLPGSRLKSRCFSSESFVLEPQNQQACKIDELVHGLLLRGQSGGGVEFLSGDTARMNKLHTHTHTHQTTMDECIVQQL